MNNELLNLDSRITGENPIKTVFNTDDVIIGDIGFFTDDLCDFENLDSIDLKFSYIMNIDLSKEYSFQSSQSRLYYRYFLPLAELSHEDQRPFIEKYPSLFAMKQEETEETDDNDDTDDDTSENQQSLLTIDKIENEGNGLLVHATIKNKKALQNLVNILYLID